jgi:DNA-binding beta-propeller fold protein YncE
MSGHLVTVNTASAPVPYARYRFSSLSLIDLRAGHLLRTVPLTRTVFFTREVFNLAPQHTLAVDTRRGRLYVRVQGVDPHKPGAVLGFDDRTGALATAWPVGLNPQHVAVVAPLEGRVVVSDFGGFGSMGVPGDVRIFATRTGRAIRTGGPGAVLGRDGYADLVAVDEARGQTWVVNVRFRHQPTVAFVILSTMLGKPQMSLPLPQSGGYINIQSLALDTRRGHLWAGGYDIAGSFAMVALFDTRSHRLLNGISPSPAATEPITSGNVDTSVVVDARTRAAFAATAFLRPSLAGPPAVTMLSARTGRAIRTTFLHIPGYAAGYTARCDVSGAAIDSRRASLYVPLECTAYGGGNARSFVAVLDIRRGVLRRLVPIGRGRPGIAVDTASGRVYAYSFGGKTLTIVCAAGAVTRC